MKIIITLTILLVILLLTSETDPTCSENNRLKVQDYDRWVKSGGVDCKVYSNKLLK